MIYWLVVSTPLKNISQIGSSSQLLIGEKKKMFRFQTINQFMVMYGFCWFWWFVDPLFFPTSLCGVIVFLVVHFRPASRPAPARPAHTTCSHTTYTLDKNGSLYDPAGTES